jgi:hypothetical protein
MLGWAIIALPLFALLLTIFDSCNSAHAARSRTPAAKLGMIAAAPDTATPGDFTAARDLGMDPLYTYRAWADGDGAQVLDLLGAGGHVAINLSVVQTTTMGRYPAPWKSFADPGFAQAFGAWAGTLAAKHEPAYVFVGNEANTFLHAHPELVDAYVAVVRETAAGVRAASPKTRVGVVLSFRDVARHSQWALARRLAAEVDLVGFTVYGYRDPDFTFADPAEGMKWLDAIETAWTGPYAIVETGWNSAAVLGSSEAMQADFARRLVSRATTLRAEFVAWFLRRDGADCTVAARRFLTPEQLALPPTLLEERLAIFKAFLCSFGAYHADGSEKPAAAELRK